MNWHEAYRRSHSIENIVFIFVTMFSFYGFTYVAMAIYPNFFIRYGLEAAIGHYFLVPLFFMIYGALIYFFGLFVINRKRYDHSGIFNIHAKQTKKRINKYEVYFLPVQYWGIIFFCIGVAILIVQIVYNICYS